MWVGNHSEGGEDQCCCPGGQVQGFSKEVSSKEQQGPLGTPSRRPEPSAGKTAPVLNSSNLSGELFPFEPTYSLYADASNSASA